MLLWRAHGLGNDYLVLESGERLSPALVRALCDRHRGIGSDGVLEPVPGIGECAYGLRIHNPDGTEAEKSGNGLRIYAHWLVHHRGAPTEFSVWTLGGVVRCVVRGTDVWVDMGPARVWGPEALAGHACWRVDLGNPHAVCFAEPIDWRERGAAIETSVPGRANVQFVSVEGNAARALVWERGVGETQASGSSACAIAAVCVARGLLRSPVTVRMAGGELVVAVGDTLVLSGPVAPVGRFSVDGDWLLAHTPAGGRPAGPCPQVGLGPVAPRRAP
ncbi:MAG: diaminopimelate epimerase [Myxococcales bacterium]|nr:diaminopimelate epimerase [Myxococcales bacterium]